MSRFLLIVILAIGLMLSACAPPESTGGSGNKQQSEKPVKEERQAKEEQPDKERPKSETNTDGGKKEKPKEPKEPNRKPKPPKSKPKPAPSKPKPAPSPDNALEPRGRYDATVTVSRVVDGDTIEISPAVDGNEEVRLIGVDTPETKDPSEGIEPLGPEASAFATDELTGQSVGLEFDVEREDQYYRLLAYVYLGRQMFNQILVEKGYAQASPYPPNTRYEARFATAQQRAKAAGLGIWGLTLAQQCQLADQGNGIGEGSPGCAGASASATASTSASASASASSSATANPSAGGAVSPISEDNCPPNAPIKGNQSSGIYHVPSGDYYDVTDPEECFATPQDAEAAGYRASEV